MQLLEWRWFCTLLASMVIISLIAQEQRPHVVFIAIDDLRPELGCYGNPIVQSPHLDRLAAQGMMFKNHFTTVPTCGASRYSLLSGMLPRSREAITNHAFVDLLDRKAEPDTPETFIHHLRRNGYYTVGIGKISHSADGLIYGYEESPSDQLELPYSWDEMLFDAGQWITGWNAFFGYADGSNRQSKQSQVYPYEEGEVDDLGYPDGRTTELALKEIDDMRGSAQPVFLGVGFFKPHLPFNAPKKYWDLYDRENIPISKNSGLPQNVSLASLHQSNELNRYALGEEKASLDQRISDEYARKLIHAYYASISYIDTQVGKIIDKLKDEGLYERSLIIVWGDHGWHLGDQRVWGKHTLFERALKSALIIKPPNNELGSMELSEIVSTVDIYPTIMDICKLEMPYSGDGESLSGLWQGSSEAWRNTAYGYYRQGISLRTPQYRFTRYFREQEPDVELYDHRQSDLELINIAEETPIVIDQLMPHWEMGNTGIFGQ